MEGGYLDKTPLDEFGVNYNKPKSVTDDNGLDSLKQLVGVLALMTPIIQKDGHVLLAYLLEMAQIEAIQAIDKARAGNN